jgi:hypothetical protein
MFIENIRIDTLQCPKHCIFKVYVKYLVFINIKRNKTKRDKFVDRNSLTGLFLCELFPYTGGVVI